MNIKVERAVNQLSPCSCGTVLVVAHSGMNSDRVFEETRLSKISLPKGVNVIEVWRQCTTRDFICTMEFLDNGATHHKQVKRLFPSS